ncbi:hypothetical protein Tco_1058584 [Tanacetum coccineum]|uniref:Uncharacterized protein n=1 Tax=Tanacetum coccineum TaxID=301880 RepID=A0ABQ5H8P5_9ASTR
MRTSTHSQSSITDPKTFGKTEDDSEGHTGHALVSGLRLLKTYDGICISRVILLKDWTQSILCRQVVISDLEEPSEAYMLFDEPVPSATEVNAQVVPPGTSLSTTIAQDAPSTSASSSTSDSHLPVQHQEN